MNPLSPVPTKPVPESLSDSKEVLIKNIVLPISAVNYVAESVYTSEGSSTYSDPSVGVSYTDKSGDMASYKSDSNTIENASVIPTSYIHKTDGTTYTTNPEPTTYTTSAVTYEGKPDQDAGAQNYQVNYTQSSQLYTTPDTTSSTHKENPKNQDTITYSIQDDSSSNKNVTYTQSGNVTYTQSNDSIATYTQPEQITYTQQQPSDNYAISPQQVVYTTDAASESGSVPATTLPHNISLPNQSNSSVSLASTVITPFTISDIVEFLPRVKVSNNIFGEEGWKFQNNLKVLSVSYIMSNILPEDLEKIVEHCTLSYKVTNI